MNAKEVVEEVTRLFKKQYEPEVLLLDRADKLDNLLTAIEIEAIDLL